MTSAVITLVREAIGRTVVSPLAQSTWPVAASTRMPAFALTPFGAPATARPSATTFACAEAGTIAVVAVGDEDAGRVAPWAYASPGAAEQPAAVAPAARAIPAITNRAARRRIELHQTRGRKTRPDRTASCRQISRQ